MAFQRRALAYDIAKIGTFAVMDRWTQTLFEKLNEQPVSGFRRITMEQALNADKRLWVKLSDETRSNLAAPPAGPKPFDVAFERLTSHQEVLLHLTPLPFAQSFREGPREGKGDYDKGKGKGKEHDPKG